LKTAAGGAPLLLLLLLDEDEEDEDEDEELILWAVRQLAARRKSLCRATGR